MSVSVSTLIADTRVVSGLRNNQLFSDAQIAELLSDAYAQLRDRMIARFAFWFKKSYPFTLTGGDGGNTLDLSLVPDLQQVQYIERDTGSSTKETITELGSVTERNRYFAGLNYLNGRRYFVDGDTLEILPPTLAQGSYTMAYTPQYEVLAPPVTTIVSVALADGCFPSGGFLGFNLANMGGFVPAFVGGTLTTNFGAPNTGLNATYTIGATPTSAAYVVTTTPYAGQTITLPNSGSGTISYAAAGTRTDLPQALTPWALYLKVHASLAIKRSRKQDTSALERQMAQLEQRIVTATKARSQGVQQAPVSNVRRRGIYGGGY